MFCCYSEFHAIAIIRQLTDFRVPTKTFHSTMVLSALLPYANFMTILFQIVFSIYIYIYIYIYILWYNIIGALSFGHFISCR